MPLDPLSLASSATQFGLGALQSLIGGRKEKKATDALEALKTPTYGGSSSIKDYYTQALQRYNVNPYQSQQYQFAMNNANAGTAAGINALQDRRSAIGGVSRLASIQNNAGLRAGVTAEQQKSQNFGQLGNATNMKAGDDKYGFQINSLMPYEKQMQLLGLKASGGASILNSGLQNIFGGLSSAAMLGSDPNNATFGNTGNGNFRRLQSASTNNPY